jgi:hypothetical protein
MLRELSLSETSRSDLCPVGAAIVARMFALATHGDHVSVSVCERFSRLRVERFKKSSCVSLGSLTRAIV